MKWFCFGGNGIVVSQDECLEIYIYYFLLTLEFFSPFNFTWWLLGDKAEKKTHAFGTSFTLCKLEENFLSL